MARQVPNTVKECKRYVSKWPDRTIAKNWRQYFTERVKWQWVAQTPNRQHLWTKGGLEFWTVPRKWHQMTTAVGWYPNLDPHHSPVYFTLWISLDSFHLISLAIFAFQIASTQHQNFHPVVTFQGNSRLKERCARIGRWGNPSDSFLAMAHQRNKKMTAPEKKWSCNVKYVERHWTHNLLGS